MAKRPMTMKEIQATKVNRPKSGDLVITNISKQVIKIHLKPPLINGNEPNKNPYKGRADFYLGAQDIALTPNQQYRFSKDRVWEEQISRLKKTRIIAVNVDTDKIEK